MSEDRFDELTLVAQWYGHVLAARPTMLDHNADPAARVRVMKVLLADAQALLSMGDGRESPDDLSPDALEYLKTLVRWGSMPVSGPKGGEWRRVLTKRSLASFVGDDMYAATDKGKALVGDVDVVEGQA